MINHIVLTTTRISATHNKPMRVRGGNVNKIRTDLNSLAKAVQHYEDGKPSHKESHAHLFKRFGQAYDKKVGWQYTTTIKRITNPLSVPTVGFFSTNIIQSTQNLLRNVLLFRGINYERIINDITSFETTRKQRLERIERILLKIKGKDERRNRLCILRSFWSKCKPHANYNVNTTVRIDGGNNIAKDVNCLRITNITVKDISKLDSNGDEAVYKIIFETSKCWNPVKDWLMKLGL